MEKNKLTAVEWLVKELPTIYWEDEYYSDLFEKAKELEKQQIIDAYFEGKEYGFTEKAEDYYNETFNR